MGMVIEVIPQYYSLIRVHIGGKSVQWEENDAGFTSNAPGFTEDHFIIDRLIL
jgi:hypothetical protein